MRGKVIVSASRSGRCRESILPHHFVDIALIVCRCAVLRVRPQLHLENGSLISWLYSVVSVPFGVISKTVPQPMFLP